jgi:hypothetical protein
MKGAWVLTTEYNDYDQYGKYFIAVFSKQPSLEELASFCHKNSIHIGASVAQGVEFLERLRKGGGRINTEHQWYNLEFVPWSN